MESSRQLRIIGHIALVLLLGAGVVHWIRISLAAQLNSDLFYIASIYHDLSDGAGLSRWTLPPAPYFFPDLPLFALLARLFGDVGTAYFAYGLVFFALFLLALWRIARRMSVHPLPIVLFPALLLVALMQNAHPATRVFVIPIFHSGTILVGLLLVGLVLDAMHDGFSRTRGLLFFTLLTLAAISDLFIVTQFVLPLLATGYVLHRRGELARLRWMALWAITLGAGVATLAIVRVLVACTPVRFSGNPLFEHADRIVTLRSLVCGAVGGALLHFLWRKAPRVVLGVVAVGAIAAAVLFRHEIPAGALGRFAHDFRDLIGHDPALWCLFVLAIVACVIRHDAAIAIFFLVQVALVFGESSVSWVGLGTMKYAPLGVIDEGTLRHMQPIFVLPPFVLAFLIAPGKRAMLVVAAFALLAIVPNADALTYALPYPEAARCVDGVIRERGLHAGYGDYWTARHLKMLLQAQTPLLSAHVPMLDLDRWVSNRAWYLTEGFDFWIPPARQESHVIARFGPPAAQIDCSGVHVLVYDRPSDVAFRNFLRLPALIANDLALPSHATPESLNVFRKNGAPQSGIVAFGTLVVTFDPPASGDLVDISADAGATLEIDGHTIQMPAGPGLQRDIIALDRARPIERLTIRAARPVHLGHVFVFPDAKTLALPGVDSRR